MNKNKVLEITVKDKYVNCELEIRLTEELACGYCSNGDKDGWTTTYWFDNDLLANIAITELILHQVPFEVSYMMARLGR